MNTIPLQRDTPMQRIAQACGRPIPERDLPTPTPETSPLQIAVNGLACSLDMLSSCIATLEERLGPVLMDTDDKCRGEPCGVPPRPIRYDLQIEQQIAEIHALTDRLKQLEARLLV